MNKQSESRGRRVLAGDAYAPGEYRMTEDERGKSRREAEDCARGR